MCCVHHGMGDGGRGTELILTHLYPQNLYAIHKEALARTPAHSLKSVFGFSFSPYLSFAPNFSFFLILHPFLPPSQHLLLAPRSVSFTQTHAHRRTHCGNTRKSELMSFRYCCYNNNNNHYDCMT